MSQLFAQTPPPPPPPICLQTSLRQLSYSLTYLNGVIGSEYILIIKIWKIGTHRDEPHSLESVIGRRPILLREKLTQLMSAKFSQRLLHTCLVCRLLLLPSPSLYDCLHPHTRITFAQSSFSLTLDIISAWLTHWKLRGTSQCISSPILNELLGPYVGWQGWSHGLRRRKWKIKKDLREAGREHVKIIWSSDRMNNAFSTMACGAVVTSESWQLARSTVITPFGSSWNRRVAFHSFAFVKILHLSFWMFTVYILLFFPFFSLLWKGVKEVPYVESLCWHASKRPLETSQLVLIVVTADSHSSWRLFGLSHSWPILHSSVVSLPLTRLQLPELPTSPSQKPFYQSFSKWSMICWAQCDFSQTLLLLRIHFFFSSVKRT